MFKCCEENKQRTEIITLGDQRPVFYTEIKRMENELVMGKMQGKTLGRQGVVCANVLGQEKCYHVQFPERLEHSQGGRNRMMQTT